MAFNFEDLNRNENAGKSFTNKTDLYLQYPNQKLKITGLKKINTKFGETYVADLETENKDIITLPKHMVEKLDKLMEDTIFTDMYHAGKLAIIPVNEKDSNGKVYCTVKIDSF